MCDSETEEELQAIKDEAFLEGIIGTLTRVKYLIDHEKDPAVAVEKLRTIIDGDGKHAMEILAVTYNMKVAQMLDH